MVKLVKALFPDEALLTEPVLDLLYGFWLETIYPNPTYFYRVNQATLLENTQVLHKRWECHRKWGHQLTGTSRTLTKALDHSATGWVGKGMKQLIVLE